MPAPRMSSASSLSSPPSAPPRSSAMASSASSSSSSHRRSALLFALLCLSLSCLLFLASAQPSSSSSTGSDPTAGGGGATSAASQSSSAASASASSAAFASASATSSPSLSSYYFSSSASSTGSSNGSAAGNVTTCWLVNPQDSSWYVFAINASTPCCHTFNVTYNNFYNVTNQTVVHTVVNGTNSTTLLNTTYTLNNQTTNATSVCNISISLLAPASTLEMIRNATCPMVNQLEVPLAVAFDNSTDTAAWCSGGAVDYNYVCDPAQPVASGGICPPADAPYLPEGPQQDSIYSPNPPYWWRCNYTSPSYSFYNETLAVEIDPLCANNDNPAYYNATTGQWNPRCLQNITGTTTEGLTVVDPLCATDNSLCAPRKYLTQINTIYPNGSTQWGGQYLPPYSQYNYHPVAIVIAGSAYVNATLFYPAVDSLQLLEVYNSYSLAFLSLSTSTRIVVETVGGFISNSRTRLNGTCAYVVPFFTLIIDMSHGYIDSLTWQDDCTTCTSEAFVYSDDGACNCGIPINSCIGYNASVHSSTTLSSSSSYANASVSCDLQIYVAYSGTDGGGNVLTSASRTIANFRKWSLNSLYQSAVGFYSNIPSLTSNFDNCATWNAAHTVCLAYANQ